MSYHISLIPKEIKLTIQKNLLALANTKNLCKNNLNYCLAVTKTKTSSLDFTNCSPGKTSLICKIKQESKYQTCLDKIKPKFYLPRKTQTTSTVVSKFKKLHFDRTNPFLS
jgi:hypothetical protein